MNSKQNKVSVVLAASLAFGATPALASTKGDRRAALDEIREMREDTRTVTASEMPALRDAMSLESPSATKVASVLHGRTPTGRLFVKFVTEPNPDVATTDAEALVEEIFSNRGKPSEKLFLTKTNIQSLEIHGLYDTPIRAKIALLDTMIVERLEKDRTARIAAGDVVILAVASGFALHAGFNGTNRAAAALREVNWKALPGEANAMASKQIGRATEATREFGSTIAESVEHGAATVYTHGAAGVARATTRMAPKHSQMAVQGEVNLLYQSFKNKIETDSVLRQALNVTEQSVKTTEFRPSQIEKLSIGLDKTSDLATRVVFRKEYVEDSMRKYKTFASESLPHDQAHQLFDLFAETKPLQFVPVAKGALQSASEEIREASQNVSNAAQHAAEQGAQATEEGAQAAQQALDNPKGTLRRLGDTAERRYAQGRAAWERQFQDFDRTAALLEGSKIGAVGIIAWHAGNAFGFDDGQDHAVTYLEDQIPQDRLQPVEVTQPAQ